MKRLNRKGKTALGLAVLSSVCAVLWLYGALSRQEGSGLLIGIVWLAAAVIHWAAFWKGEKGP